MNKANKQLKKKLGEERYNRLKQIKQDQSIDVILQELIKSVNTLIKMQVNT